MLPGPSAHLQNGTRILYNLFPPVRSILYANTLFPVFLFSSHPLCKVYFIYPDIYFTPVAHNHKFIGGADDTEATLGMGNLVLLTAARPTTDPFLATACFVVEVEVSSLGNVGTQILSIIKFGSLYLGTLSPQFNAHH